MSKITFIGTGAFASALASVLAYNNHNIKMWGINQSEIDDINNGMNKKYFLNKKFNNEENIWATNDLKKALKNSEFLILAVPSEAFNNVIPKIKEIIKKRKINIINVAKGIDSKTRSFYSQTLTNEFGENLKNFCTLVGPSFAIEVFNNEFTMVNVVGKKNNYLKKVSELFNNNYFSVVTNQDENGAQLFASLKNVYAIGMGILSNISDSRNTLAALLTVAIKEMFLLREFLFGKSKKDIGINFASIGDTFLTCTSEKSRNYSFGIKIYQKGIQQALEENKTTVEGYRNALIFYDKLRNKKIDLPFLFNIFKILFENKNADLLLDFLSKKKN
ncbi:NAD(P)H-dependent glycerol-3-phosphate dehydrogenase [Mycoplasma sp. 744]|uniref:NAD(P)H-dependent glycerol-3-phosphate dehydrogenase n=1 Tax=Mycoplasma sp. 744 TaxID=3108531 RepID=UPI002B1DBCD2|nr:NAD(P)H-dependent glycerol-3-phosphate dehydrogenase [Mycoplasma sp. 744]MEA4115351.1 NAD(P)H-dependent glycerol-3-phosphate dehydrogenase [Mycoplasma sp. 744]